MITTNSKIFHFGFNFIRKSTSKIFSVTTVESTTYSTTTTSVKSTLMDLCPECPKEDTLIPPRYITLPPGRGIHIYIFFGHTFLDTRFTWASSNGSHLCPEKYFFTSHFDTPQPHKYIHMYVIEWFQMKTHFFKQTSGSDKVLAHAIRSNLRQILFENFHG